MAKKTTVPAAESAAETAAVQTAAVAEEKKAETVTEVAAAEKKKPAAKRKRTTSRTKKKTETAAPEEKTADKTAAAPAKKPAAKRTRKPAAKKASASKKTTKTAVKKEETAAMTVQETLPQDQGPRRSIAFIGSECYPFVKTGGLGDVMYALPKALANMNCDVKVILPRYKCIKPEYQEKMVYRGEFYMDLCSDGRQFYVGIMEYVWDGVVYDFIDNEEFFSAGNPYTNLVDDIPKYCFFCKAALAALNYLDWTPDIIHCHDWQAALVPVYQQAMFADTNVGRSKTVLTIHNLRFQGQYNRDTIQYWSGLPDYVFTTEALSERWTEANLFKGGLAFCDKITTVSNTYANEIQTWEYGENLDDHLRYHAPKLCGIVNGIDCDIWNPSTDTRLPANYSVSDAIAQKKEDKKALQERLGLEIDENKMLIGLVSRLTNQKGLDLVNDVFRGIVDENTQVVILGTGDAVYEDSFRQFESEFKGSVCSYIAYSEDIAHEIYAGADALLVPSKFEPCGLTQLIGMHYGAIPVVRETGGLKDTVEPYNVYENTGNGFTFDRYESSLLYDAINRAKTLYFENREKWDEMVIRNMEKDVSWAKSAQQYKDLYLEITPR